MAKIKKYVVKIGENNFLAKLARFQDGESIVQKEGFIHHQDAMNWLEDDLEKIKPSYAKMSFHKLATLLEEQPNNRNLRDTLKWKIEQLKEGMLLELIIVDGLSEKKALKQVNEKYGKNWTQSYQKAKDHTLDALVSLEQEKDEERLQSLVQYTKHATWQGSEKALHVLEIINLILGAKKVTVNINNETQAFDIDESGVVGYSPEHENLFLKKIDMAFEQPNSFIVRQFIPNSEEEVVAKNGKKIKMPWKALYSFVLTGDELLCVDADDLEHSCTHDINGNKIDEEPMVIYKDFSEVLAG